MIKINDNILESDILVVGGGIGGLMAAIAAADAGSSVIVAEKSDTRRSGSGATGNDHFNCYIPEYHQCELEVIRQELDNSMVGGHADPYIQTKFLERSFEVVQDWYKWGINMKPHGEWEFNGHAFPGRKRIFLKYDGHNQKQVLTNEAKKRGVIIQNKTPITEYLTDDSGKIIGAVGIDIRGEEPILTIFKVKAVISATGNTSRLYPSITPSQLFNTAHCPNNAGAGRAAAYRAGARLVNLEIPNTHAGPKYFERCGKATWIGVISDSTGEAIGPFVKKPDKELGDITADVWHSVFRDKMEDGTGPVYMNCTETAKEDLDYMKWGLVCEGDTALLDALSDNDIEFERDMVEFTQYEPILIGRGIEIDEHGRTNVPGLYAAGDEVGNFRADIAGAAVIGRFAGEDSSRYVKTASAYDGDILKHKKVTEIRDKYTALLENEGVSTWQAFNQGIQQILNDYAGIKYVRSKTLLDAGLLYLGQLKERAASELSVKNSHELMRAIECFDLLELGRLICLTALERKETRLMHRRSDFPFTNPLYNNKFLLIHQENGHDILEWRDKVITRRNEGATRN